LGRSLVALLGTIQAIQASGVDLLLRAKTGMLAIAKKVACPSQRPA
jgi:hypothetical protein